MVARLAKLSSKTEGAHKEKKMVYVPESPIDYGPDCSPSLKGSIFRILISNQKFQIFRDN